MAAQRPAGSDRRPVTVRRSVNRSMFWRVIRRSIFANRGRLFVILLALGVGAAITAALLNLQVDAKRRMTTEFRTFGANILIVPSSPTEVRTSSTLSVHELNEPLKHLGGPSATYSAFLYFLATVQKSRLNYVSEKVNGLQVVSAGTSLGASLNLLIPGWNTSDMLFYDLEAAQSSCIVGENVAKRLGVQKGDYIDLFYDGRTERLLVKQMVSAGESVDDQVFVELSVAQRLSGMADRATLVRLSYPGTPVQIEDFRSALAARLPDVEVLPIRRFTEGQARLYGRISGILTATVAVVLLLTALCVMAAMTNIAAERKNDVGLMKAIGGSLRRVLRLFLAEAALLGLAGGLIGAAVGIVLSIGLGKAVFGVAAQPRLIVYPISVALTVIVAILAAYPLRRLAQIRPASVIRGEE
jgi:putative ABC transport system permease protein